MSPRIAVVQFPGSNCEQDVVWAAELAGAEAYIVFHDQTDLGDPDAVVLPGGFAHGDYLRTGAIARFSPAMKTVREMADSGRPVLGICNGFQILCEAGIVRGALMRNSGLRFICAPVELEVVDNTTPFTSAYNVGDRIIVPINHYEGNFVPPIGTEPDLVFKYTDNPNGSWRDAAGVRNSNGNVVGMMPHPERASDEFLGSSDGLKVFESLVAHCERVSA